MHSDMILLPVATIPSTSTTKLEQHGWFANFIRKEKRIQMIDLKYLSDCASNRLYAIILIG